MSCGGTTNNVMFLCFYVSLDLASVFFLLARSGRKTDGHIIKKRMFIKFLCFFLPMQGPWLGCDFFERRGEKHRHKTVLGLCVSDCEGSSSHKFRMGLSFHPKRGQLYVTVLKSYIS